MSIKKLPVWILTAFVFIFFVELPSQTQPTVTDLSDPIIERGRKLYMAHCASCHGDAGVGDGPLADSIETTMLNLQAHTIHHDQATLFQMIAQGYGSEMPGFATELDMDQILDLIEYSYTLDASYQLAFSQAQAASASTQQANTTTESSNLATTVNAQIGEDVVCPSHIVDEAESSEFVFDPIDLMDAVGLGADLDGDNDPDEIVICLQILELAQTSSDGLQRIAPGIDLPVWVFAPDLGGMEPTARFPSPTIRVEQGDRVKIILKNTHYFPHTLHLDGVLKPNNMDGVSGVTQLAVQPGESFSYEFVAQNPGTHWYHGGVQNPLNTLMGLYGMFIIEEEGPQNFVTPLVLISEMPEVSAGNQEAGYASEYVLLYQDIDPTLHEFINDPNLSPAQLEKIIYRDYNILERQPTYFVLNGRAFPYTLIDTQVEVRPDEHALLRVLNAGLQPLNLHLHGHYATAIAINGVAVPPEQRRLQDTFPVGAGQRIDIDLNTSEDGVHGSGPGVWLIHDHTAEATTTNGIYPGGNLAYIVYEEFKDVYGLPKVAGDPSKYFNPSYYEGTEALFEGESYQDNSIVTDIGDSFVVKMFEVLPLWAWITISAVVGLLIGILLIQLVINLMQKSSDTRRET